MGNCCSCCCDQSALNEKNQDTRISYQYPFQISRSLDATSDTLYNSFKQTSGDLIDERDLV
jgi:hypothetical protein